MRANTKYARKVALNPDHRPMVVTRPGVWDETFLTETWAERKARRALEKASAR